MKNKKLLDALSLADDKYVDEAAPGKLVKKKRHFNPKLWATVAACLCVAIIGAGLWMFIPLSNEPPSVEEYADSEYYEIIKRINSLNYRAPSYKNNYEKYFKGKLLNKAEDMSMEMTADTILETGAASAGGMDGSPAESYYEEITDNQVNGIIEDDLIKRSNTHIFYLSGSQLEAYSIDGENSAVVGRCVVTNDFRSILGFYLSADCTTATVIYSRYDSASKQFNTELVNVDVSDPVNMQTVKSVTVSGRYVSSRLVGNELLLLTGYSASSKPDFSDASTFVPQVKTQEGSQCVSMDSIVYPDKLTSSSYTVVCKLNQGNLVVTDRSAFLSYTENVYVSAENIYVAREYKEEYDGMDGWLWRRSMTEVSFINYNTFDFVGSVQAEGYIKDQYSLDQNGDVLRMVTTTSSNRYKRLEDENEYTAEMAWVDGTSANLYCFNIRSGELISSVIGFAPKGETVRSVRFDGNSAYVCTAVQITDPVFFFDLSDPSNITYKDTGTITGFSTSLVNLCDGFLLGIGVGNDSVKIEIYTETASGVRSVCSKEYKYASYSEKYKSYYIDRENLLIGLGIDQYNKATNKEDSKYVVLEFDFDGVSLYERISAEVTGDNANKRGVYIDGYMYMLGDNGLTVEALD